MFSYDYFGVFLTNFGPKAFAAGAYGLIRRGFGEFAGRFLWNASPWRSDEELFGERNTSRIAFVSGFWFGSKMWEEFV